jgi:adenine-specific DNA-methyltransferase
MALLEEKIAEIPDPALRQVIAEEVGRLKKQTKFGLVYEEHQPEVVTIHNARVKRGERVVMRGGSLTDIWLVTSVRDGNAYCERDMDANEARVFPVEHLVVVRRMGEAIYPALTPLGSVANGDAGLPHHILLEGDNYHALQLMLFPYEGKVDCIYIDPPYNTGARDWKYNNDYVDSNDSWRHSKWLTFMARRLRIAHRLLKTDGVLIVTIDDYEAHHLRCLLSEVFVGYNIFTIVIEHNKRGRQGEEFAKTHEYAFVVCPEVAGAIGEEPTEGVIGGETRNLRRTGNNSLRADRPNQFYPIWVNPETLEIVKTGPALPLGQTRSDNPVDGLIPIWPVDRQGVERNWYYGPDRLMAEYAVNKAFARRQSYGIHIYYTLKEKTSKRYKTVWSKPTLDASTYGSELLNKIFGSSAQFSYPKSLYAVRDSVATVCLHRPDALIVDFFAGSGTTLNAVNLLNAADGGRRQCILVTNNEVSEEEARALTEQGYKPGDDEWDQHGICRSVTWPRSKITILGRREDGTPIPGEYLTGRQVLRERSRSVRQLGFAEGRDLTLAQRKQIAALIPGLPTSKISDEPWFLADDLPISVLWDSRHAASWLDVLGSAEHVTDIFIMTTEAKLFNSLKAEIANVMGPYSVSEEEKRPMANGFTGCLEYFRLDFLDPREIQMGRQFGAILPILWMMAGAKGKRPEAPNSPVPWLLPKGCPFAVLMQETRFKDFLRHVNSRTDLTHIFIVTNSVETVHKLRQEWPEREVVQLYKDYLDNFRLNLSENAAT